MYKQIDDLPYSVSNTGEVRNNRTGKVLKPYSGVSKSATYTFCVDLQKQYLSLVALMRKYWRYEFIKDLADDEECKPLRNHSDYFITSKGRVFSLKTYSWLQANKSTRIYYHTHHSIDGNLMATHRLVGRHFLPDFREDLNVLHTDEDLPSHLVNCVENLWLGTQQDNNDDKISKGRANHTFGRL